MDKEEILKFYEKTINELDPIYNDLTRSGKLDLQDNNFYLGISFVSKIIGLNTIFSDEFIKEYNLKPVVDWIDKKTVMMQASHYSDKNLFYEFFNVIFPQLKYRLSQIKYFNSLSSEEKKRLIITPSYQVYLYKLLKNYLEQTSTEEIQKKISEILSIINLYKIVDDKNIVCLGSKITYMDSLTNTINYGRIVLSSHGDLSSHKLPLNKYKELISKKKEDIVMLDYSTSFFIRILDIDNSSAI